MYEDLKEQTRNSFNELCETAQFKPGSLIVVGGSSSEVRGGVIGKDSSYEVGKTVTSTIIEEAGKRHLRLAFQCCEHLNRALIMEREDAEFFGYDLSLIHISEPTRH